MNQAQAGHERAEAVRQSRLNASRTAIHAVYFRLQNARRLVELYRHDLLPQATGALQTAEAWFREGYAEFTDLIEAQATLYNFQLTLARARADYGKHFARLEALVGHPLAAPGPPAAGGAKGGGRAVRQRLFGLAAAIAIATAATAVAQSEYRKLDDAFDRYQPPAHLFRPPAPAQPRNRRGVRGPTRPKNSACWNSRPTGATRWTIFPHPPPFTGRMRRFWRACRKPAADVAAAQQAVHGEFALPVSEVLALLRSPAVAAAQKRMRAAIERYSQVTALDDVLRRYSAFAEGAVTGVGAMPGHGGGGAPFPIPGVLALKGAHRHPGGDGSARTPGRCAPRRRDRGAQASLALVAYLHRAVSITTRTIALLRELEQVSITRYEAGRTSFQDVIKVQVQRQLLDERLATLHQQMQTTHVALREVLRLPPDNPDRPAAGGPGRRRRAGSGDAVRGGAPAPPGTQGATPPAWASWTP